MRVLDVGSNKRYNESWIVGIDLHTGDIIADMHELPFKDKTFDLVTACHSIEHTNRPHQMLKEIKRVMKDNAKLFISTPNLAAWHCRLFLLFGQEPAYAYDPRHFKCYTLKPIDWLIDLSHMDIIFNQTYPNKRKGLLNILEKFFNLFKMGSNLIVVCKKHR